MSLHTWFGRHTPNLQTSHWRSGQFVSACTKCDQEMIKPPGQGWQAAPDAMPTRSGRG